MSAVTQVRRRAYKVGRATWIRYNASPSRLSYRLAQTRGRRVVPCVGDSHLKPLRRIQRRGSLPHTTLKIFSVEGATASGVVNPNSQTRALPIFLRALENAPRGADVIVSLGEIDAGFLSFLRSQNDEQGRTPRFFTEEALQRYADFVESHVIEPGFRPLLLSATYPTIAEYKTWKGMGGARRQVRASIQERAEETAFFNSSMAEWCRTTGVPWLDMTPATVNGLSVKPEFIHPDAENHHLHPERHADVLEELLRSNGIT